MKHKLKQMLPVAGIILITVIVSLILYSRVVENEEYRCWQMLSDAAQSVSREITMKFDDEITKIQLWADMLLEEDDIEEDDIDLSKLEKFETTTIFSRIDVIYPDNTVLFEDGTKKPLLEKYSFEQIAAKGECVSKRMTDLETGKECVYYILPVHENGKTRAILIGVISSDELSEIFLSTIYNGEANCCIIDRLDGNFIMDSWHDELGNAYKEVYRKRLNGYEDVDLKSEIKNGKTGVVAFVSKTTGNALYMYYTPLEIFDWQLSIFVEETEVFENLIYIKKLLFGVGVVEIFLIVIYFLWNLFTINKLEKSRAESEKQKELLKYVSYRDMLTNVYNRNKYIQVLDSLENTILENAGVVYIDLNGLKAINDSQSHEAGDAFICGVAKIISEVFANKAYRIGGDEFVVLDWEIEENDFFEKIADLKDRMEKQELSVSVGFNWKETCKNLDSMLKQTEKQMYQEKEKYYETHIRIR